MTEPEALAILKGIDPRRAAEAAAALWAMWHRAGRPEIDRLLRDGIAAMEKQDLPKADGIFTAMIERLPAYAEGWNKRATVRYMASDYQSSIADCRETIARNPNHFGALSGQGLCHMALGEHREAADCFRRTLEVHPHLESARENLRSALHEIVRWN